MPEQHIDDIEAYMIRLAHVSQRIIGAVHDEGPDMSGLHITAALAIEPPDGIDPTRALIAVLACQVDPRADVEERLGWVCDGLAGVRSLPAPDHRAIDRLAQRPPTALPPMPTEFDDAVLEQVVAGTMPLDSLGKSRRREAVQRLYERGMNPLAIAHHVRHPSTNIYRYVDQIDAERDQLVSA